MVSCDSLYLPICLPNFGDSGLPSDLSSLMDPRRVVGFQVFFSFFPVVRTGVMTSKLLICWTGNQKSLHLYHILCLPFCYYKLSLFLSKDSPPLVHYISSLFHYTGYYSSKSPLFLLHHNISLFLSHSHRLKNALKVPILKQQTKQIHKTKLTPSLEYTS